MGVTMRITRWNDWQTFRKDRGTPNWIKVYRNLMTNVEWCSLSDAEKGQLVSMWILAADKHGEIPDNPLLIAKMAMLDAPPDLNKFIDLGFVEGERLPDGNHMVTTYCQNDCSEESRVEERRVEEINRISTNVEILAKTSDEVSGPVEPKEKIPYKEITNLYHEILPMLPQVRKMTDIRRKYIRQRWLEDLPNLDEWRDYFTYVSQSKFLTGKVAGNNGSPPFEANLEWLCRPSNYTKVLERKYHR